jgi:hypothetical protein
MEGTQRITDDLDRLCRVAASSNKAIKFAPYGRRTPLSGRRLWLALYAQPSPNQPRELDHRMTNEKAALGNYGYRSDR